MLSEGHHEEPLFEQQSVAAAHADTTCHAHRRRDVEHIRRPIRSLSLPKQSKLEQRCSDTTSNAPNAIIPAPRQSAINATWCQRLRYQPPPSARTAMSKWGCPEGVPSMLQRNNAGLEMPTLMRGTALCLRQQKNSTYTLRDCVTAGACALALGGCRWENAGPTRVASPDLPRNDRKLPAPILFVYQVKTRYEYWLFFSGNGRH